MLFLGKPEKKKTVIWDLTDQLNQKKNVLLTQNNFSRGMTVTKLLINASIIKCRRCRKTHDVTWGGIIGNLCRENFYEIRGISVVFKILHCNFHVVNNLSVYGVNIREIRNFLYTPSPRMINEWYAIESDLFANVELRKTSHKMHTMSNDRELV